jgi:hypothetical protein
MTITMTMTMTMRKTELQCYQERDGLAKVESLQQTRSKKPLSYSTEDLKALVLVRGINDAVPPIST